MSTFEVKPPSRRCSRRIIWHSAMTHRASARLLHTRAGELTGAMAPISAEGVDDHGTGRGGPGP